MTVKQLAKKLGELKSSLQDKEIVIEAQNGLLLSPEIKFKLYDSHDILNRSDENVEQIILSWR